MSLYSCNQFSGRKGLGHIIICTKTQSADLVDVVLFGGYHDDGYIFLRPYFSADIESVGSRKHKIKDHKIVIIIHCRIKAVISAIEGLDFKTVHLQIIFLEIGNFFLIFDYQNLSHNCPPCIS